MNWGDNFFLELFATPTLETLAGTGSAHLSERVAQVPGKLKSTSSNLNAQPYGRLVVARFPEMVRKLAAYTRSGFDTDHAVLRCYLPAVAGHNLAAGRRADAGRDAGRRRHGRSVALA